MDNVTISFIPAVGMMIVASAAVIFWHRVSKLQFRWFWMGAGLWVVAVALKMACGLLTNEPVIGFLKESLSYPLLILGGGLYFGIQSSLFEIGLTFMAVLFWRQIGRDANLAIGIGIGAGAFEAFLLGIASIVAISTFLFGLPGAEKVGEGIDAVAAVTPLFWLLAPTERIIAILCHASSRALVLLGVTNRKHHLVFWGFFLFTLLDGIAGALHVSGKIGQISMWWIELAMLPFALISILVLTLCHARWDKSNDYRKVSETSAQQTH